MSAPLIFIYKDADGFITKRHLSSIISESDKYFGGLQSDNNETRTFRKDRVQEVLTEEEFNSCDLPTTSAGLREERRKNNPRINPDGVYEIAFTGIKRTTRSELEKISEERGLLVRTRVTKNLNLLVAGPTAGPTKLVKAYEQGVQIIDEADFMWLIETGELPD